MENNKRNEMEQEYQNIFLPQIHRWGRTTMVVALILSLLPIGYMYFIKGWKVDIASYSSVIFAISSFGIGMWLTEPMSYFPILVSAGTYMSYFSGNVSNMRAPVALSVQSALDTEVQTPRGNIATIMAIGVSVFVNLGILLIIIILGQKLLEIFPPVVLGSFKYLIPSLYGGSIVMRFKNNPRLALKYSIPAIILYFIVRQIPGVSTFALAIVIAGTILFGYIEYKVKNN